MPPPPTTTFKLILGGMWAGKSSALLAAVAAHRGLYPRARVSVFKPSCDTRGSEDPRVASPRLETHVEGHTIPATPISNAGDIGLQSYAPHDMVVLDELHMLGKDVVAWVREHVLERPTSGLVIVGAGLAGDSDCKAWNIITQLIPLASDIVHLKSRCELCGAHATTTRARRAKPQFLLGGADEYGPRCTACHGLPDVVYVEGPVWSLVYELLESLRRSEGASDTYEFAPDHEHIARLERIAFEENRHSDSTERMKACLHLRRARESREASAVAAARGSTRIVVLNGSTDADENVGMHLLYVRDTDDALLCRGDLMRYHATRPPLRRRHVVLDTNLDMSLYQKGGSVWTAPTTVEFNAYSERFNDVVSTTPHWSRVASDPTLDTLKTAIHNAVRSK